MEEHKINYCMGCMSPLYGNKKCTKCGFDISLYNVSKRCLMPGTILAGRYMAGRVTGEGGFGITYIGRDMVLDIVIAIKEYFPLSYGIRGPRKSNDNTVYVNQSSADDIYHKGLERFYNEAKILSQFHMLEGIVTVRDFFYENQTAYIVMDYINGINLKRYVKENGAIPGNKVLELMQPVIKSLGIIHQAGIIHRDISPDNLILAENGQLVLVDFGSAKTGERNVTQSVTVMFKRGFTPEEQYLGRSRLGAWTDVYSLCATMYYMLTGIVPDESIERMLDDKLRGLSGFPQVDIPKKQKEAIMQGISLKPEERFQDMQELYDILYNKDGKNLISINKRNLKKHYFKITVASFAIIISGYFIILNSNLQTVKENIPHNTPETVTFKKSFEVFTPQPENIKMQLFTGLTKEQAEKRLALSGDKQLEIEWKEKYNSKVKKGTIITQNIPADTSYYPGSIKTLVLTISLGTKKIKVPDVTGKHYKTAIKKLKNKKLPYKLIWKENREENGIVILQDIKAGKLVKPGQKIYLTISSGIKTTPVPVPNKTAAPEQQPVSVPEETKTPVKKPYKKEIKTDISEPDNFIGIIP